MKTSLPVELPMVVDVCRKRLGENLLDPRAAQQLDRALAVARSAGPGGGAPVRAAAALEALSEVCAVLQGGALWEAAASPARPPLTISRSVLAALIIHPREKQQRHHTFASLLGRVLHLVQGDEVARTVARVTEVATLDSFPRFYRLAGQCARSLGVAAPEVHIVRGQEPLFAVMLDKTPFLCVHRSFLGPDEAGAADRGSPGLSDAEARFAIAHQLAHVKSGHAALLQISPEQLEALVLDQVPFLVRAPIRLASKAIGWTQANVAVKKVGSRLPKRSPVQRVVKTVGDILPGRDQETVLPETVHEWVRSWIQGVEYSADRAGLLVSGSLAASCAAVLRLSPHYAPEALAIMAGGARWLFQNQADADRSTADRLRELLQFTLSTEYLSFIAAR